MTETHSFILIPLYCVSVCTISRTFSRVERSSNIVSQPEAQRHPGKSGRCLCEQRWRNGRLGRCELEMLPSAAPVSWSYKLCPTLPLAFNPFLLADSTKFI